MNKQLTIQDVVSKYGDFKTIFSVEDGTHERLIHIFGYVYYTEDGTATPYRLLEYTFFYVPLKEVVEKGLYKVEMERQEEYKQYLQDLSYEDILTVYNNYNGGKPLTVLDKLTIDTPEGYYILEND